MTDKVEVVRTTDVIAAEIRALTASMLTNIVEIGRRMVEAKEILPHGTFGTWLKENTGYSSSTANNFMRMFREYGSPQGSLFGAEVNCQTFGNLNYSQALALLEVPMEERESFVVENHVEDMSTRELKKAIQERKDALRALEEAKARAVSAEESRAKMETDVRMTKELLEAANEEKCAVLAEVADLKKHIHEIENKPVEVAVQEPDPAVVEKAVDEALARVREQHKTELDKLNQKLVQLEKMAKKSKKTSGMAEDMEEKRRLESEIERLSKQLAMSGTEVTVFKFHFAAWQQTYTRMVESLKEVPEESRAKLQAAVTAQIGQWIAKMGGLT